MEEQSLGPEIDSGLTDGLDSLDPPFLLPDENPVEVAAPTPSIEIVSPQVKDKAELGDSAVDHEVNIEEPQQPVIGTRRRAPVQVPVESAAAAETVSLEAEEEAEIDDDEAADEEEYVEEPPRRLVGTRRRAPSQAEYEPAPATQGTGCADLITAIFLLMTVGICGFTLLLLIYPRSPLNPFPAPTLPAVMVIASPLPTDTPTNTFTPLPATETPTPTPTFTPTATFTATWTPSATFTPVVGGVPIVTTSPTIKPEATQPQYTLSPFAFTVDPLRYIANTSPDGCNWQSIVVITKDLTHNPVKGIAFRVTGGGGNIDEVDYTGNVPRFGDGSFELVLGTVPREDQFTIQVLSRNGQQISDTVTVGTHTNCTQNVVVVTFVQNHEY